MPNKQLRAVLALGTLAFLLTISVFKSVDVFSDRYMHIWLLDAQLQFVKDDYQVDKPVTKSSRGYHFDAGSSRVALPAEDLEGYEVFGLDRADIESVTLTKVLSSGLIEKTEIRRSTPLKERPYLDQNPSFSLKSSNADDEALQYYLDISTAYPIVLRPKLWTTTTEYLSTQRISENIAWIYFGIIAILLLINLFVYLNSKIQAYLYYAIFLAFHAISIGALEGFYLGTSLAQFKWIHPILISSLPLTVIFALKFLEDFLNLKKDYPNCFRILKLLRVCFYCLLIQIVLIPFPTLWALVINIQSILVIIASAVYPAIAGYRALNGKREHVLIFFAFIPHFIAVIYYALQVLGLVAFDPNNYFKLLGSSFVEMLFISIALGLLVRSIQQAKMQSDRQAIENLSRAVKAETKNSAELEQQVKERTLALETAVKEKTRLLETLSHDLRAPMNSIVQYSEITLESSEDYDLEDYKSFVTDINESTKSLYSLLENLLTWTRTNWGGVRIQEEATNLRRLIHNQIQVYAVQINSKAIKTDLPETEISVIVDQNMLKTVLRNVITNALTHMRNGGRLSFRWEANSNDRLTLRVVNEGHPIREDIAKALSEGDPFDAKVDIVSTGLGLRLCKATSDANEWSFKIEPLDDATQVTLSLKLDTNQAR